MIDGDIVKEIDPGRGTVPVLIKGKVLIPIKVLVESLGDTVSWVNPKVTISLNGKVIELWINKKSEMVNGSVKTLEVPPQIINQRTMLPLRFISENLGYKVDWQSGKIIITN